MTHASLFTGIGGFDLAAQWVGWNNVFHCEIEEYKIERLKINFPKSESYADITTTDFRKHRGLVDVLSGGFPCQDASIAHSHKGGQQGIDGNRTGLVFQMLRAIDEIRPKFIVAENVSNLLRINGGKDFGRILGTLSRMGYNAEWRTCYASEYGAPHKRKRLYMVIYPNGFRLQTGETFFPIMDKEAIPNPWNFARTIVPLIRGNSWSSEPPILCLDDGVSRKLVRQQLHGYGNAIVPQIAFEIFKVIKKHLQIQQFPTK